MRCRDIMTKYLKLCRSDATAKDAVKIMKDLNCGVVPVVNDKNEPIGIVTDRDIAIHTVLNERNPEKVHLSDFMTKDVVCIQEDEDIDNAIGKMRDYKIRRLPVVNSSGQIVGIISLGDIAVSVPEEHEIYEVC